MVWELAVVLEVEGSLMGILSHFAVVGSHVMYVC